MALLHVWLWTTLLTLVLTRTVSHISNKRRKIAHLADTTAEEGINGGAAAEVIIVAGVCGTTLAYALAKIWLWTTLLAFVLTLTVLQISNERRKMAKLAEAAAEERSNSGDGHGGADVIVVGAGVCGSALAYALATDGRQVNVIERDMREPERTVGEIMQPGGRLMLAKLGLQDCLEGIDEQKLTGLTLYKDGEKAILPFPVENNDFPYEPSARSFHNGRFVQRLRQKACSLPNVRIEEGTVKSLIEEKGVIKGIRYKTSVGEETTAFASLTVVCDGCNSSLRRSVIDNTAEVFSYGVGYISKNCRLEEPDTVHLIMSKPSISTLYQLSSTEVRCIFEVFRSNVLSFSNGEMAIFFKTTIAPQIPPKLREIFMKGIDEGAKMKVVAVKSLSSKSSEKKGVIVLGDAFNMRHPVIASGMMVILSDIVILRHLLKPLGDLGDANKVSEVLKSFYNIRKPMSATVNTLGSTLSQVLVASTDQAKEALRQGLFDYLSGGGFCASEVMAFVGGMNPRPVSLIHKFIAITLFFVGHLLSPFPFPSRIWHSLKIVGLGLRMLGPHFKAEGMRQMLFSANAAAYRKNYMDTTLTTLY